jgi:methylated-DNA-[protein]-cysteine S-methyltransferase
MMGPHNLFFYDTAVGMVGIADNGKAITDLFFCGNSCDGSMALHIAGKTPEDSVVVKETELIKEAALQLKDYLQGVRRSFQLPLSPTGTSFQMEVWKALLEIPYGETRSYGEIAKAIGKPKACRAVGMACNRNKIAIFIPCHRVIGADGKLVGFGGGLSIKKKLLDIEGSCKNPEAAVESPRGM